MSTKRFEKGLGRGEGFRGVHHDYLKSLEQGNIPQARYDGLEMMRLVDLRGMNITRGSAPSFVPRVSVGVSEVEAVVSGLLAEVKREGSAALIRQAKDFDGVTDVQLSVSEKDIRAAAKKTRSRHKERSLGIDSQGAGGLGRFTSRCLSHRVSRRWERGDALCPRG